MTLTCDHIDELPGVARDLLSQLERPQVVLVNGEMGAGKTTLIAAMCKELGSIDEASSPTFALVNEYQTSGGEPIFHFDLYRIEDETEAYDIGIEEYFSSGHFCFVEWPERISTLFPENCPKVDIKVEAGKRIISLS
jgi:tRNA threonylcarbamoyladenosine biosynthesis protein TsaE